MQVLRKSVYIGIGGFVFGLLFTVISGMFVIGGIGVSALATGLVFASIMVGSAIFYYSLIGRPWAIATYFALLMFFMDSTLRLRDLQDVSLDWQAMMKLALWMGALAIGLVHLPRTHRLLFKTPSICLVLYGIWAILTMLYSDTPSYTLGAALSFLGLVLFAPVVLEFLTMRSIIMILASVITVFLVLSWPIYWWMPEMGSTSFLTNEGYTYRMNGLAGKPTNLGRLAAVSLGCLFVLGYMKHLRWKLILVPGIIALATLFASQTRTALIGIVMAISIVYLRRHSGWLLLFAVICCFVYYIFYLGLFTLNLNSLLLPLSRSGELEELFTFTARTEIWGFVLEKIKESPWFGYGYASSRAIISSGYSSEWGWTTGSAHNMILGNMLTTGLIGTSLILAVLVRQLKHFFTRPDPFCDTMFVFIAINGLMEAIVVGMTPSMLSLLWLITVYWREKKHEAIVYRLDPVYAKA